MQNEHEGPGKYDEICTLARQAVNAEGAVIIIINGDLGSGFSVQGPLELNEKLPDMLEHMARQIRQAVANGSNNSRKH